MKNIRLLMIILFITISILPSRVFASEGNGWIEEADKTIEKDTEETVSALDESSSTEHGKQSEEIFKNIDSPASGIELDKTDNREAKEIYETYAKTIPKISTEQIMTYFYRKSNEVIRILQSIISPIAIIIFILGAFFAAFGSLGNGALISKGIMAMIVSAISYSAVLYAPILLSIFHNFVSS